MQTLIDRITEDDGDLGDPATPEDLAAAEQALRKLGRPPLPAQLRQFLARANGLMWNGVELFATDGDPEDETTPRGIVAMNAGGPDMEDAAADDSDDEEDGLFDVTGDAPEGMPERLLAIGASDEDLYVYDAVDESYAIVDPVDYAVMESFDSLEALLQFVIDERS